MRSVFAVLALVCVMLTIGPSGLAYAQADEAPDKEDILFGRAVAFAQPRSPWDQQWQVFKANMAKNPSFDMDYFTRGERGSEEQMMHDLRRGRSHIGGMSLQGLAYTVPELNIVMAPFVFSSTEEVDYVYDNHLLDFYNELFAEKGLVILQWVEVGWTNIYSNGAILVPADAQGKRLRGSPNRAAQFFLKSIGADSIPLGSSDIVPSLQTGLIQGGLSSTVFHFFVSRAYATDFTLTRHAYDTGAIVVNADWLARTTPSQRETLMTAWPSPAEARSGVRNLVAFALDTMRKEGIRIHELTPDQRAIWEAAGQSTVEDLIVSIGGRSAEAYAVLQEGKRAFAARQAQEAAE